MERRGDRYAHVADVTHASRQLDTGPPTGTPYGWASVGSMVEDPGAHVDTGWALL
jgi:hypothetical protein